MLFGFGANPAAALSESVLRPSVPGKGGLPQAGGALGPPYLPALHGAARTRHVYAAHRRNRHVLGVLAAAG